MKSKTIILLILIGLSDPLFSQNTEYQKWEYLVITFGNTRFGNQEKTQLYWYFFDGIPKEGISLQSNLDFLGNLGWELVTIVGAIGGDQQLVLKRQFIPDFAEIEEEIIVQLMEKRNAEREADEKIRQEEEAQREILLEEKKVLVDRDVIEQNQRFADMDAAIDSYINSIADRITGENIVSKEVKDESYRYIITIEYDLTSTHLSNINEYSKSQVEEYLNSQLSALPVVEKRLYYKELIVRMKGIIVFNEETVAVGGVEKRFND